MEGGRGGEGVGGRLEQTGERGIEQMVYREVGQETGWSQRPRLTHVLLL